MSEPPDGGRPASDGTQPGTDAVGAGTRRSRWRGRGLRGERMVVPRAKFRSYYGRPVLKEPAWGAPDVPGYLFLGGLAGASSVLAGFAQLAGDRELSRAAKTAAAGAIGVSFVTLIHDLGRPQRFLNMLRVAKITSPMSVGSWLLSAYGPAAGATAACALTGRLPRTGAAAATAAAALGAGVATYTAALICDTAVPAWHEGYREMPYLFAGSAASAAGGLGMLTVPRAHAGHAARFAILGGAAELTAKRLLLRRLGPAAEPYQAGSPGAVLQAAEALTLAGMAAAAAAGRTRAAGVLAGSALLVASGLTRFGIFAAGQASTRDPAYVIGPQRERLRDTHMPRGQAG
jgi:formate-dependent nitrite reductase membrane component NrfD